MSFAGDAAAALLMVRDVLEWSATPARWADISNTAATLTTAIALGDDEALQEAVYTLELLAPVRGPARVLDSRVPAPDMVRSRLAAAARILEDLTAPDQTGTQFFPVAIYLSDGAVHDAVEHAVTDLAESADLVIASRQPPLTGSWFRRMRAVLRTPAGEEVLATAVHAADARLARRPDAEVTAMLLQNLSPVITALQPTKDAIIRVGAVLIVKTDWMVVVHQLTSRQQLVLDHLPGLETAPHLILHELGLPRGGEGPPGGTPRTAGLTDPDGVSLPAPPGRLAAGVRGSSPSRRECRRAAPAARSA
jgi:hypothetical protein